MLHTLSEKILMIPRAITQLKLNCMILIIQKKSSSFLKTTQGRLGANDELFQITMAEMLKNVKDSNRQPFINKDGTLSQGINFYANNDRNYHSQKKIS